MFRGSVKGTGYPLHSAVSLSLPPPLRHRVPSHFNWTLPRLPWLSVCCRWNFLRDTGGVHWINTWCSPLVYLLIWICGVKSTLSQSNKLKSYSHNIKENGCRFPPEILYLFFFTTLYPTSLTSLAHSTASFSHPIPLSATNQFSRLKLSICNPSYSPRAVSSMYVHSLNVRRAVPNCPQLTPAIFLRDKTDVRLQYLT